MYIYLNKSGHKPDIPVEFESENYQKINFQWGLVLLDKSVKNIYFDDAHDQILIFSGFIYDLEIEAKKLNINLRENNPLLLFKNQSIEQIVKTLKIVDGFFNLICVNKKSGEVNIFSDHIGSKVIYFMKTINCIKLSSDIKQILNSDKIKKINKEKLIDYISFMDDSKDDTFFQNIYKTNPREHLKISSEGVSRNTYFEFKLKTIKDKHKDWFINEYKQVFENSVKNCTSDVNGTIGAALSGGLDSSSIVCMLKHLNKKGVKTKTAVFAGLSDDEDRKANETIYSDCVSNKTNFLNDEVVLGEKGCITDINKSLEVFSEPKCLVNAYIHHEIFKSLRTENIKFFLDGFAGDSVINHGYSLLPKLGKSLNIPELIKQDKALHEKKGGSTTIYRTLKRNFLIPIIPPFFAWVLDNINKRRNIYNVWASRLNKKYRASGIYSAIVKRLGSYPGSLQHTPEEWHLKEITSTTITASVRDCQYLGQFYDVEIRFPFLSKKLMQLSLNTPIELKLRNGIDRYIFRKAMTGIVPKMVLERTDKGNLSFPSKKQIESLDTTKLIYDLKTRLGNFFDYEYIEKSIFNDKRGNFTEIYQLYELNKWLELNDICLDY